MGGGGRRAASSRRSRSNSSLAGGASCGGRASPPGATATLRAGTHSALTLVPPGRQGLLLHRGVAPLPGSRCREAVGLAFKPDTLIAEPSPQHQHKGIHLFLTVVRRHCIMSLRALSTLGVPSAGWPHQQLPLPHAHLLAPASPTGTSVEFHPQASHFLAPPWRSWAHRRTHPALQDPPARGL